MRIAHYGVLGDGAESLAGFDNWQERAAFQFCKTLENADAAGFVLEQVDEDDLVLDDGWLTDLDGWVGDCTTWFETSLSGLETEQEDATFEEDEFAARSLPGGFPQFPLPARFVAAQKSRALDVAALPTSGLAIGSELALAILKRFSPLEWVEISIRVIQLGANLWEKWVEHKARKSYDDLPDVVRQALLDEEGKSVFTGKDVKDNVLTIGQILRMALVSSVVDPDTDEANNRALLTLLIANSGVKLTTIKGEEIEISGLMPIISADIENLIE